MNEILQLDSDLLLFINGHHCAFMDQLMWYVSQALTWVPLYFCMGAFLFKKYPTKWAFAALLLLIAAAGAADYISSGLIKHWVERPRPTHEPALEGLVHLVRGYTGGQYGFVSSHAANTSTIALLYCLLTRNRVWAWFLTAFVLLNCYSRMYLGVHYPGDILGGLLVGTLIASLFYYLAIKCSAFNNLRSTTNNAQ